MTNHAFEIDLRNNMHYDDNAMCAHVHTSPPVLLFLSEGETRCIHYQESGMPALLAFPCVSFVKCTFKNVP